METEQLFVLEHYSEFMEKNITTILRWDCLKLKGVWTLCGMKTDIPVNTILMYGDGWLIKFLLENTDDFKLAKFEIQEERKRDTWQNDGKEEYKKSI